MEVSYGGEGGGEKNEWTPALKSSWNLSSVVLSRSCKNDRQSIEKFPRH